MILFNVVALTQESFKDTVKDVKRYGSFGYSLSSVANFKY